jgi:MFS family permease
MNKATLGYFSWAIATFFYFFDNLLNVAPSAIKPELAQAFAISAADLGVLSAAYLWVYGMMQLPAGVCMDLYGPRRVLSLASISCALGCYLFAIAAELWVAVLGRAFIGLGASFAVVGCCKLAALWFPLKRFALLMGLMVAVGMGGAAFSVAMVHELVSYFGSWRVCLLFAAKMALLLAVFMYACLREPKEAQQQEQSFAVLPALRQVLFSSQVWVLAIFAGLMFVPTLTFGGLWGIPFLVEAHQFSRGEAGFLVSLIFIGWVLGGPVYGWISDYLQRRKAPMYFAAWSSLLCVALIIYCPLPYLGLATCMFALGVCSSGFVLAFAVAKERSPLPQAGTVVGFMNMLNTFLGGALLQQLIGYYLDCLLQDKTGDCCGLSQYRLAMSCIPLSLVFAIIMLVFVKETHCKGVISSGEVH